MEWNNEQLAKLRKEMLKAFDQDGLELFLQDYLSINLAAEVNTTGSFEMICLRFLTWAQKQGHLDAFLGAVQSYHTNAGFKAAVTGLTSPVKSKRTHRVSNRPVLNRSRFWDHLDDLVKGTEKNRVLVVNGGVGKTYSRWPLSAMIPLVKRVDLDLGSVVNVDAARLATLIADQVWGKNSLPLDSLPQAARQAKELAVEMVQRLSTLSGRTWLAIDQLNAVNLDQSAADFLGLLCEAVDGKECPEVRLFLLGLDVTKLSANVALSLPVEVVQRPLRTDIEDYVVQFCAEVKKIISPASLATVVDKLDGVLATEPDHANWKLFHSELFDQCQKIEQGIIQ